MIEDKEVYCIYLPYTDMYAEAFSQDKSSPTHSSGTSFGISGTKVTARSTSVRIIHEDFVSISQQLECSLTCFYEILWQLPFLIQGNVFIFTFTIIPSCPIWIVITINWFWISNNWHENRSKRDGSKCYIK